MLEGSLIPEYNKYLAKPVVDTLLKTKVDILPKSEIKKEDEEPIVTEQPIVG